MNVGIRTQTVWINWDMAAIWFKFMSKIGNCWTCLSMPLVGQQPTSEPYPAIGIQWLPPQLTEFNIPVVSWLFRDTDVPPCSTPQNPKTPKLRMCLIGCVKLDFPKTPNQKTQKNTSTWECYSDLVGFRNSAQHDPDISRPSVSLGAKKTSAIAGPNRRLPR